jgi:hypothetical protein
METILGMTTMEEKITLTLLTPLPTMEPIKKRKNFQQIDKI